ncbi:MAG TPA: hypothetical protein VEX38_09660, partial [Fimbriimonadaceae bacterium]|nr:hypothetical protein [Fimbriimonadaceae bacterium]
MARRNLKLLRAFPGAPSLRPIFERFFKREGGILTALSDASLRACAGLVPEESEVECVPFGEVVARFLALAGGDRVTLAQRGHINAAVVEACLNIPKESPLFDSKNFAGLHRTVASGLDELRAWGYGQDELLIASERLPGRLGTKLRSLAEVDDHVDRILGTLARRTNSDQIRACLELRPERALGIRLLVVAGSHDDPLDLAWLRWAESSGAEILVVTERALSDDLFQGAKEIVTAL